MEITKTLLINAACLLIPPVVVVLLLRHFFPRKIRWSAGVVALVDLVIFWTDIFYYESVWLTLFFVVIQLAMVLEMSRNVQSGNTQNLKSSAASNQAACCACTHSRYLAGGSPSGLRV